MQNETVPLGKGSSYNEIRGGALLGNLRTAFLERLCPNAAIIEAVWDHLVRERNKRQPISKEELWDVLQEAWRTIPEDY